MDEIRQNLRIIERNITFLAQFPQGFQDKQTGCTVVGVIVPGVGQHNPVGREVDQNLRDLILEVDPGIDHPTPETLLVPGATEARIGRSVGAQWRVVFFQKVIDAIIPIGRGQRELILGDRQTGKTSIALDTIINQKDKGVLCIYCAIGKQSASVARFIADLKKYGAMEYSMVMLATGEDPPGLQFVAPYAATTMGEYFMAKGHDVLVIYDDLTAHARAYRELSLLLRRPPGREAFPGDIFYIHSRLLERSTHLKEELGGGSLTALPIVETEAQNMSAYIPTNLISITDGQIYLSPDLFQKGILPAVDVGKSVSRVGGKTQLAAYRAVAGDLRLSYSQFEELEAFARFGTRLDEATLKTLERGHRVREVLKQSEYEPLSVAEQIASFLTVTAGIFDAVEIDQIDEAETLIRKALMQQLPDVCHRIEIGEKLSDDDKEAVLRMAENTLTARYGQP